MTSASLASPAVPPAAVAVPGRAPLALPLVAAAGVAFLIAVKLGAVAFALAYALAGLFGLGPALTYGVLAAGVAATAYAAAAIFRRALAVERELAAGSPAAAR